jgi:hypothetical protein
MGMKINIDLFEEDRKVGGKNWMAVDPGAGLGEKREAIRRHNWERHHRRRLKDYSPDEPRDPQGRWTTGGAGGSSSGEEFVSPNIGHLDFDGAVKALEGKRHALYKYAAHAVDVATEISPNTSDRDVVGAWADGAENSTMTMTPKVDHETLRLNAAMKGYLAAQKSVLIFDDDPAGKHSLYRFQLPGDLSKAHQQLLDAGVSFHTLLPHDGKSDVVVVDLDGSARSGIEKLGVNAKVTHGTAEFIGTTKEDGTDDEQRADARRQYQDLIDHSRSEARRVWPKLRDRWDARLAKVKDARLDDYSPDQPRGKTSAESTPGSFAPEAAFSDDDAKEITKFDLLGKPAAKKGTRNVGAIGRDLDKRTQEKLKALGIRGGKITIDNHNDRTDALLAKAIAQETKDELEKSGNAADWYSKKVDEAVKVFAIDHPEVRTDPLARSAFAAALAITSQGEVVDSNARLATEAYEHFRKTGRFPEDIKASAQVQMNNNFAKYNALLDEAGEQPAKVADFLKQQTTVRELEEKGFKGARLPKDTTVNGSAIFGPKIGNGFYQNLTGNFEPTTQDMWFMRTWGRLTGTLKDVVSTKKGVDQQYDRFTKALKEDRTNQIPENRNALNAMARKIYAQHERDYANNADEYKSGARVKSEVVKSAERIVNRLEGINEDPGGGAARLWRERVMEKARAELDKEGVHLTAADHQATIWYPEKTLWEHLGSKGARGGLVDYSGAFQRLARKKHSEEEIKVALRDAQPPGEYGYAPWVDDPDEYIEMTKEEIASAAKNAMKKPLGR